MSLKAAPVSEVTNAMLAGYLGMGFFSCGSKSPSLSSWRLSASKRRRNSPSPAVSIWLMISWKSPRLSYSET